MHLFILLSALVHRIQQSRKLILNNNSSIILGLPLVRDT